VHEDQGHTALARSHERLGEASQRRLLRREAVRIDVGNHVGLV
jgi:hypothetical protein